MHRFYRFLAWSLIVVGAVIGILRATAIRWWKVPLNDLELATSLAPTLRGGDWVLLWRLTKPGLGSLVMCPDPDEPNAVVIGRIVATQGHHVAITGTEVKLDGQVPPIEYNCTDLKFTVTNPDTLKPVELSCDMEDISGKLHARGMGKPEVTPRAFSKSVGMGEVFLLSDNRVHPFDSRHFGTLPAERCRQSIVFRLVSDAGFFDVANRLDYIR